MAQSQQVRYAFNRGLISSLALGRVDLKHAALAAELCVNWMPKALGPMMLRPGLGYIGATLLNNAARYIPFVRSLSGMHLLEFTNTFMRVWNSDVLLERVPVTTTVLNGDFLTNLANWTDQDEVGAVSQWTAAGGMVLLGTGTNAAMRLQQVTVIAANQNKEHALRINVGGGPGFGPVTLRVGSTSGGDEYIAEVDLGPGGHSLAFTPTGNFYIRFQSRLTYSVNVTNCTVETPGVVAMPSPYLAANLDYIRAGSDSLSVDVMFVACSGVRQYRIERRNSGRSWSVVKYTPEDGPFRLPNTTTQTMTAAALTGNTTLTSSVAFFRSTHVGALFRLTSVGQTVTKLMGVVNDSTAGIRVVGVTDTRTISITLTGLTGTGNTVVLQRSFDNSTWETVSGQSWTADVATTYADGLDNQVIWYRLRCTVYAAGTTTAVLFIATGSITGIARAVTYNSNTSMDVEVLSAFGSTTATDDWAEGRWSDYRGWPSAVAIYEGRLNWDGIGQIVLSVSDAYDSFNADTEGDSGPIDRTIGSGPLQTINWAVPLKRLVLGGEIAEHSVYSNSFDEPVTPTAFNRKECSTEGSAPVQAVRSNAGAFFVQRGGTRVFELHYDPANNYDYSSTDATLLCPDVGKGGDGASAHIVRMAAQTQPDKRLHIILSDGTAGVLIFDKDQEVRCWVTVEADGDIEDVVVLPGTSGTAEDQVYYVLNCTINGATVRFLLKWALESQCQGGIAQDPATGLPYQSGLPNRQADAFVVCAGGSTVLTGLSHLEGETVIAWGNAKYLGTYVVAGGQITASETVDANGAVVGLGYTARFMSAELGQTLTKLKNIDHLGLMLKNTHIQGLEFGLDFDNMDNLPLMVDGAPVDPTGANAIHTLYHTNPQEFPGSWQVDSRLCLRATAPKPATVLAAVLEGQVT